MHARNEDGRAAWTRPVCRSTTMDQAGATTLDGQNVTNHHEGDAHRIARTAADVQAGVAQLHIGEDDAHDCHSAS